MTASLHVLNSKFYTQVCGVGCYTACHSQPASGLATRTSNYWEVPLLLVRVSGLKIKKDYRIISWQLPYYVFGVALDTQWCKFKAVIFLTIIHHITCADDILQLNDATTNMNDSNTWNKILHGRRMDQWLCDKCHTLNPLNMDQPAPD